MENEEQVQESTLETTEEQTTLESETTEETDDVDALKERLAKAEELAKNQRIRAEKAERLAKKPVEQKKEEVAPSDAMSAKDFLALSENKVSSEDFDEVVRVSKVLGKSIAETLKDKTMKIILTNRQEERQSAQATATTSTRRTSRTDSDSELLRNAERGIVPEGADDIARFAAARLAAKKAALKR